MWVVLDDRDEVDDESVELLEARSLCGVHRKSTYSKCIGWYGRCIACCCIRCLTYMVPHTFFEQFWVSSYISFPWSMTKTSNFKI